MLRQIPVSKMAISLSLAILAALTLIGINEVGYTRSSSALESIHRSQQTRSTLNQLLRNMLNAETGQRGFLLTGDAKYLEPYQSAVTQIDENLKQLSSVYQGNTALLRQLTELAQNVARKLSEMDLSVRMRQQNNEDTWKFIITTDVGREQMDAIRAQSQSLIAQSNGEIEAGQRQIVQSLQLGRIGIALVALGGLLAFYLYLRQTIALQQAGARQQQALEQERLHLEDLVHERTASLAELATHLQKVREDERSHLARELHDELGALLTAAKLDVARLKSKVDPGLQDMHERIRHLTDTLNSGIALKRRIVEDLHPSSLYHLGLRASLEILAKEFADRSGIVVDTGVEDVALDAAAQLTVYRLVQEALTNIGKYAEATEVSVTVRSYPGHAEVDVKDNGKGFDTTHLKPSTHGLAGMRHRVEAAGGRLSVRSQPGRGTQVSASLPKQR